MEPFFCIDLLYTHTHTHIYIIFYLYIKRSGGQCPGSFLKGNCGANAPSLAAKVLILFKY